MNVSGSIFESCDISFKNKPKSHAVSLALVLCACSDSAMPLLLCVCLHNNSKWCLPSFASPFFRTVLLLLWFLQPFKPFFFDNIICALRRKDRHCVLVHRFCISRKGATGGGGTVGSGTGGSGKWDRGKWEVGQGEVGQWDRGKWEVGQGEVGQGDRGKWDRGTGGSGTGGGGWSPPQGAVHMAAARLGCKRTMGLGGSILSPWIHEQA